MNPSSRDTSPRAESIANIPAMQWLEDNQDHNGQSRPLSLVHQRLARRSMQHTPVRHLMSPAVRCIAATASVRETAQAMQSAECACIVVVERGTVVGIVTERDMIRILADIMLICPVEKLCIKDFMSAPPLCLSENATLYDALRLAESRKLGQIPVLDKADRVVGLLTRDTLNHAQRAAVEQERDALEQQIYSRSRKLREANRELQALALQDSLLKVGNRRAMEMDMQSAHLNALRYGHPYALGLIDVDYFKRYNDHYGHCAGDRALITVANCAMDSIRRGDRVYRYGGEELLVLMPETSLHEAKEAMYRLAHNLFDLNLEHSQSPHQRLTISAGVSAFPGTNTGVKDGWAAVLEEADAFLYRAKALGRNQVYGLAEDNAVE